MSEYQAVVIGGGVGGLVCANLLAKSGIEVCLIERKSYPFHRVCGEYVSNEVSEFLKSNNLLPHRIDMPQIKSFRLTSVNGKSATTRLDLGGFGISRYSFDSFLAQQARNNGVTIHENCLVEDISFENDTFSIMTNNQGIINAPISVGAFGKRSNIDKRLNRNFLKRPSPYIGVKYHIEIDIPDDEISLHNFRGGYCGISRVENNLVNLCYLSERNNLKSQKDIPEMEQNILHQNPFLKQIWDQARFVFDSPLVINEVTFESKNPIEDHILMVGDSAGMITPLCGNGMAMAIHAAKLASGEIVHYFNSTHRSRKLLEKNFENIWKKNFSTRLRIGRNLQDLFGGVFISNFSVGLLKNVKPLGNLIISKTHGKPISIS